MKLRSASNGYAFVTYVGFIGIVVMLGLPEVPRLRRKLYEMFEGGARRDMLEVGEEISGQIRRYLGTTLATSILTGVASSLWSWMTGLELVLVWGILNFLLTSSPSSATSSASSRLCSSRSSSSAGGRCRCWFSQGSLFCR
jgi:AI-2 transport protein TqsA